eukprot:CAMPEP_0177655938 /NCGR_PEP_ID=MMETSP0447-20121125/15262_1 /TAXON_ID=0 /ORGANISM="Stygamoeba regulata, Strain BSH-02190019" /LENGTH=630 /DNA_ID=CAMNT_0019159947 /DNA_START=23 /DNA_END=1912 /DNA_ORIENTATION=+
MSLSSSTPISSEQVTVRIQLSPATPSKLSSASSEASAVPPSFGASGTSSEKLDHTPSTASSASTAAPQSNPLLGSSRQQRILISESASALGEKVSALVCARALETPRLRIALTVGMTSRNAYLSVQRGWQRGACDLASCHFYLFDEFYGPPASLSASTANRSNDATVASSASAAFAPLKCSIDSKSAAAPHFYELREDFLASFPMEQIHRPPPLLSPALAASEYREVLRINTLDLAILAIGPGGRVGWIRSLGEDQQFVNVVDLESEPEQQNKNYGACVTMGLSDVMRIKEVILLSVDRNKSRVVRDVLEEVESGHIRSVAAYLIANHPNIWVLLDSAAASELKHKDAGPQAQVYKDFTFLTRSHDLPSNKNVICISPHPDDTSISAGAALALLADRNHVYSCVATTGHHAYIPGADSPAERIKVRELEAANEAHLLGAAVDYLRLPLYDRSGSQYNEDDILLLVEYFRLREPHIIFLPHTADTHPTHRNVLRAVLGALSQLLSANHQEALKQSPAATESTLSIELFMYEGPWSLFPPRGYNTVCSPPSDMFSKKMAAIDAHVSQTGRTPYGKAAEALAVLRASLVPEQDLAGFGEQPPKLEDKVELFYRVVLRTPSDVAKLVTWFDAHQ